MIRLDLPKESYWLDLPHGVRLKVKPLTTAIYETARADSQRRVKKIQEEMVEAKAVGATLEGLPDFNDDAALTGFSQFLFVQSLAKAAAEDWEGVLDENGKPASLTPASIDELMRLHSMAENFLVKYTSDYVRLICEGESSTAGVDGTSAEAPAIASSVKS